MRERTVMVVDDHPLFRLGLRRILDQDPELTVIAEAASGHEALHQAEIHRPALVLLDVQLPGVTGLQVATVLRRQWPDTSVVFLSMHVDEERLVAAVRAGVAGFLTKDAEPAVILDSIHAVLRGENPLRETILADPRLAQRALDGDRAAGGRPRGTDEAEVLLSPRELEVLDCLAMGRSNKEIGESLYITEQTVKNHMTAVLSKLEVEDRMAALRYAVANGWAQIGPQPHAPIERAPEDEPAAGPGEPRRGGRD